MNTITLKPNTIKDRGLPAIFEQHLWWRDALPLFAECVVCLWEAASCVSRKDRINITRLGQLPYRETHIQAPTGNGGAFLLTPQNHLLSVVVRPAPKGRGFFVSEAHMRTATVKFFNTERGFGFLAPDDGGKDVFFHFTSVDRKQKPAEGDRVQFLSEQGDRGEKATRVVPV